MTLFYFLFKKIILKILYAQFIVLSISMLHVRLDAWLGLRAVARSVTALLLLGLWLFAFPAKVWGTVGGVG